MIFRRRSRKPVYKVRIEEVRTGWVWHAYRNGMSIFGTGGIADTESAAKSEAEDRIRKDIEARQRRAAAYVYEYSGGDA